MVVPVTLSLAIEVEDGDMNRVSSESQYKRLNVL